MTAGYSGAPQAGKLGVKPGHRIYLDHPPPRWRLNDPPDDVVYAKASGACDLVISFFTAADQLSSRLPDLTQRIFPDGALWVAWPRRAGGHQSDITDNIIRESALSLGVVDVKVAAIDADWSGQRYVWHVANRSRK